MAESADSSYAYPLWSRTRRGNGSAVPVHGALNWPFADAPRPQFVEYPVSEPQRSDEALNVECPVNATAGVHAADGE